MDRSAAVAEQLSHKFTEPAAHSPPGVRARQIFRRAGRPSELPSVAGD